MAFLTLYSCFHMKQMSATFKDTLLNRGPATPNAIGASTVPQGSLAVHTSQNSVPKTDAATLVDPTVNITDPVIDKTPKAEQTDRLLQPGQRLWHSRLSPLLHQLDRKPSLQPILPLVEARPIAPQELLERSHVL